MAKIRASNGHSLLWQLIHESSERRSYVFGTMHTRERKVHAFLPLIQPFLKECQVVSTEFRLEEQEAMPDVSMFAAGDWWERLSKSQQRQVRRQLERLNLGDVDQYRHLAPLLLVQAITSELLGKEAPLSLDFALAHQGRELGLRWEGIETLEKQWGLLKTLSVKDQCRQLVDMVSHFSKFKKQLRRQVQWYLKQDIQRLYKVTRKSLKNLRKPLLLKRNESMALRIADMSSRESCFHAIGAAHLGGGKGVLRLLKKQGFILQPISLQLESDS